MYVLLNAPLGFNHSIRCLILVQFVSTVKYEYIHGTKNCTYILFSNVYIFYQYISTLQCTPLYVVSIAFQRKGSVIGWCQCLGEPARCSLGTASPRPTKVSGWKFTHHGWRSNHWWKSNHWLVFHPAPSWNSDHLYHRCYLNLNLKI